MTEMEIIRKQFSDFNMIQNFIPEINYYNYPKETKNEIGIKTSKFTVENYIDRYKEIIYNNEYNILFNDESVIVFYYKFDKDGYVIGYNLSYIPSVNSEIDIDDYEMTKNIKLLLFESYLDYMRVDFDDLGYKEIIHTRNHVHKGIGKYLDDNYRREVRIPLTHVLYPFDYIYIICKYVYHTNADDVYINKLLNKETGRRIILEDNELGLLCLNFREK